MADAVELEVRGVVVGLFQENCWIIGSRKRGEAVVVDPGDQPEEILALARDMGVRIVRMVASHAHVDHIMAARAIGEATQAPFLLHAGDEGIAAALPATARALLGVDAPPPPEPARWLAGGEDLEVAGVEISVIHTPGHTPGSVSLYVPSAGLLFSGDTLFREAIGRTDLPGGSFPALERSLVRLMELPDDTRVLPGHMRQTTIGYERVANGYVVAALQARHSEGAPGPGH